MGIWWMCNPMAGGFALDVEGVSAPEVLNYCSERGSLRLLIRTKSSPWQVFLNTGSSEHAGFIEKEVARLSKESLMPWAQVKRPDGTSRSQ